MQPLDHQNRLDSLDPLKSVCVTAPAGSGKTELLIQRILVLLSRVNNPEEILAITFTRKAASEMHQRIVSALELARDSDEPEEEHKRLTWSLARNAIARNELCGWHLLDNPKRLKIQTIDGFCASLTRQMPILSSFGSQPQIGGAADKYYRQAVRSFLGSLESDGPVADRLMLLMAHLDNDMGRVETLLVSLLERRDQWLVHIVFAGYETEVRAGLEATAQSVINDTLERIAIQLQPYAAELLPLLDYAGSNLLADHSDSSVTALAGIVDFPCMDGSLDPVWLALADMMLTTQNRWRKTVNVKNGFPTQTIDGDKELAKQRKTQFSALLSQLSVDKLLLEALIELRHLPSAQFSSSQWQLLEALSTLLPVLAAQLQTVFQQYGEVDYIQVAIAALESLGGDKQPSELLLKLDYQLQHILLDEFQDTSSSQFDLLKKLVEGWAEHNQVNPQAPKTLFIVGDGMQSIYAFRAANVGLFLEARQFGVNQLQLQDLPLGVNFRSRPVVIDWINHTFERAFPSVDNIARGAVRYESSSSFKKADESSGVSVNGFTGEDAQRSEASYIASLVQELQAKDPEQSIAILVRSRNHLREIIPALKHADLNWAANDIDPLAQYPFINDLLILTRAMANLQDRVAWGALLRSPFCGLDNRDLHCLLNQEYPTVWHAIKHSSAIKGLSSFARQRLQFLTEVTLRALDDRLRKPFRVWLEGIWMSLGGASLVTEQSQFDHVDDYFDLLETAEYAGALQSVDEFEASVLKLYASSSSHSSLQLMTIHKAKGLEFDTVILPGLSRATRANAKNLLMWREYLSGQHSGLIISPISATGEVEDDTYKHLYFEQGIAASLENTRLLYVACTRAISRLELCFCLDDEKQLPRKNTLLHAIWPAVEETVKWHNPQASDNEQFGLDFDAGQQVEADLLRVRSDWKPPQWNFQNPLSNYYLDADYATADNRPSLQDNQYARVIGTVVHLILERLVEAGCEYWLELSTEQRSRWVSQLITAQGLLSESLEEYIIEVIRHVDNTVADTRGRWIVSNEHAFSRCELALLAAGPQTVSRKVIDRCFIDGAGDFWIVDYKTGQPFDAESTEDFILRESAAYRSQLEGYRHYVKERYSSDRYRSVRLALYFTSLPVFQELS